MRRALLALASTWGLLAVLAAQAQTSMPGSAAQTPAPASSAGGGRGEPPNKNLAGADRELANGNLVVASMLYTLAIHDNSATTDQRARAYRGLGTINSEEGNTDDAIHNLNEALRLSPRDDGAFYERGNVYRSLGKQSAAINDYSQAIRLNPRNAEAFYHRGIAYGAMGNLDRAIADYDSCLAVDPKISSAYFDRGIAHLAKSDYDHAVVDFSAVVRLSPDRAQAWFNLANAYRYKKDFARAAENYTQTLRVKPSDAWALFNRGVCYMNTRDYDRARADFQQFIQTNPTKDAHIELANVYYLMGQYPQAVAEYSASHSAQGDETLSLSGGDTSVLVPGQQYDMIWEFLASRRVGQDGGKQFRDAAARLKDAPWPSPIINYLMGSISAEELMRTAKASDPQGHRSLVCEVHTYVAENTAIKGDTEVALKYYRLAYQECPADFNETNLVAAGLKRLTGNTPPSPYGGAATATPSPAATATPRAAPTRSAATKP
jgi:tetratricopeptide (TPR) repeat protein